MTGLTWGCQVALYKSEMARIGSTESPKQIHWQIHLYSLDTWLLWTHY